MFRRTRVRKIAASAHGADGSASSRKAVRSSQTSAASRVPCSYMHNATPETRSPRFSRRATSAVVWNSFDNPCRAKKCGCRGIRTSVAETRALTVSTPRLGGQSKITKSYGSPRSSASAR